MKIISYNVNGIRAAITKGFLEWLQQANPDVICLQEIKATEPNTRSRYRKSRLPLPILFLGYKKRLFWRSYFVQNQTQCSDLRNRNRAHGLRRA